jgi:ADP-heptose:LPS heptosyltransferase
LDLKIIVIRACAVGDFVLNLPALESLQESQPSAVFTFIGYPSTLEIARDFVNVTAIHSIETEPWRQLFHNPLNGLSFDRAIVWMKHPDVAENLRRSGVEKVLRADPFPTYGHAAAHLLQTLGLPAAEFPDRWQPESDQIILHPGSGSALKCWPHFSQLAGRLGSPAFLIGPLEARFDTRNHSRLENLSLREVAKVLATCRAFVGNDSGITHLAAHLGVPTVALFGPTDPRIWGPLGRRVSVIKKSALQAIAVDDVITELSYLKPQ